MVGLISIVKNRIRRRKAEARLPENKQDEFILAEPVDIKTNIWVELISKINDRINRRRAEARLPKIKSEDLFNLDQTLAIMIALYLRKFIDGISVCGATPSCFCYSEDGREIENGWDIWRDILGKMLYAFEEYPEWSNEETENPEKDSRIREGIALFAKYFGYLNY